MPISLITQLLNDERWNPEGGRLCAPLWSSIRRDGPTTFVTMIARLPSLSMSSSKRDVDQHLASCLNTGGRNSHLFAANVRHYQTRSIKPAKWAQTDWI